MLDVEAIHTYYGDSHVLHGVSLRVAPGEAVALLGRNGAGKTTAIRSIVGFTPPRAGRVLFDGRAIERWPSYRIARSGLALVPQGRRIFAPLSVRENLLLGARAPGWTLERVFALFPRLRERAQQSGGTLSGGEPVREAHHLGHVARPVERSAPALDAPQQVPRPGRAGRRGQPQVLPHRELREQVVALERAGDAAPGHRVRAQALDRRALEPDAAAGRRELSGDDVEERGLARAVGADDGAALARRHLERHVIERAQRSEGAGQRLDG